MNLAVVAPASDPGHVTACPFVGPDTPAPPPPASRPAGESPEPAASTELTT